MKNRPSTRRFFLMLFVHEKRTYCNNLEHDCTNMMLLSMQNDTIGGQNDPQLYQKEHQIAL